MSSVGRMDGAFFVSRSELLAWANSLFSLNLSKVEQCANGAVYCQVIDACHPGNVAMKKVNWSARADHEAIPNYKVLQQAFDRSGISKHIEVDKLIRGKYQDNLEMLQWIKTYFDRTFSGGDYDGLARRYTDNPPEWARPSDSAGGAPSSRPAPSSAARREPARGSRDGYASGQSRPASGQDPRFVPQAQAGGAGGYSAGQKALESEHAVLKDEYEKLREEIVDLKITVDGLETERDFYFQKLRDIEILCQALEATPDPNMTVSKFVEDVQRILYAKDDEEEGREEEPR